MELECPVVKEELTTHRRSAQGELIATPKAGSNFSLPKLLPKLRLFAVADGGLGKGQPTFLLRARVGEGRS